MHKNHLVLTGAILLVFALTVALEVEGDFIGKIVEKMHHGSKSKGPKCGSEGCVTVDASAMVNGKHGKASAGVSVQQGNNQGGISAHAEAETKRSRLGRLFPGRHHSEAKAQLSASGNSAPRYPQRNHPRHGTYEGTVGGLGFVKPISGYTVNPGFASSSNIGGVRPIYNGLESETSSLRKTVENVSNHESGNTKDKYYSKQSAFDRSEEEEDSEAYDKFDEDIEDRPDLFHSKKSGENFKKDRRRVMNERRIDNIDQERHKAGYRIDNDRFFKNIDSRHERIGDGYQMSDDLTESSGRHAEDEMFYDSGALGNPMHY